MFKKQLEYMMDNDPEKTLSVKGSENRKKIRPYFTQILKLGNKLKLEIEKNELIKTDRPIIYVASHAFKDDVLNTILTIKDDAYVVFGNIDLFYNTFDGICLWIYGTQLVDRYNKSSRNAMKDKMDKILELGNNIIIFSEATWNLSPNKPMQNLHWGFYDTAIKNNALIVPVLTNKVGKKCYSRVLSPIDPKIVDDIDIDIIKNKLNKYINKAINLNIYEDKSSLQIMEILLKLKDLVNKLISNENKEQQKQLLEKIIGDSTISLNEIKSLIESSSSINELKLESYDIIQKIIFRIINIKKEACVSKVRDIMALEKVDMYTTHPDYSYMKNGENMYEAWEKCMEDTITETPYFYLEPETTTLYKDSLIKDEHEVMPWLKK